MRDSRKNPVYYFLKQFRDIGYPDKSQYIGAMKITGIWDFQGYACVKKRDIELF